MSCFSSRLGYYLCGGKYRRLLGGGRGRSYSTKKQVMLLSEQHMCSRGETHVMLATVTLRRTGQGRETRKIPWLQAAGRRDRKLDVICDRMCTFFFFAFCLHSPSPPSISCMRACKIVLGVRVAPREKKKNQTAQNKGPIRNSRSLKPLSLSYFSVAPCNKGSNQGYDGSAEREARMER